MEMEIVATVQSAVTLYEFLFDDSIEVENMSCDDEDYDETPRNKAVRTKNFMEETVKDFTDAAFQENFRLTRTTVSFLLPMIFPLLIRVGSVGRCTIDPLKQLLAVIWLLATPDSFRSVGCRFDMAKSSLFVSFVRVIKALNIIAPNIIAWPNQQERQASQARFRRLPGNLDGVIGAIDGTYIPIKAPRDNAHSYINRKCFHAVTLQAICNDKLSFIDCFCGFPSSVSDVRVFRNSDIFTDVMNNTQEYFEGGQYILGDKAYPCLLWCIPPFVERAGISQQQKDFNTMHAQTRQVIERCFSLLFGRFRRLKYLDMNRIDLLPATVIAACVLHNLCLKKSEYFRQQFMEEGAIFMIEQFVGNQADQNNQAVNHPINNDGTMQSTDEGQALRNLIMSRILPIL